MGSFGGYIDWEKIVEGEGAMDYIATLEEECKIFLYPR